MTFADTNARRTRTRRLLATIVLATAAIGAPLVRPGPTLFLWNASASVPIGLYLVQPSAPLRTGDLAVTWLPVSVRHLASERRYLPKNVLLIKPVAAVSGTEVCRQNTDIYVDRVRIGEAMMIDHLHRPMPDWQGCHILTGSEIFLMNPSVPDSFDGRYFGPIARNLGQGRATPLLTFARSKPA